jgi:hypothetical protein
MEDTLLDEGGDRLTKAYCCGRVENRLDIRVSYYITSLMEN